MGDDGGQSIPLSPSPLSDSLAKFRIFENFFFSNLFFFQSVMKLSNISKYDVKVVNNSLKVRKFLSFICFDYGVQWLIFINTV